MDDGGTATVRYQGGERQLELLESQRGETDLAYIGGEFYLLATCEVEEPEVKKVAGYLGVDLGIVNLATDSAGHVYAGGQVNGLRRRHAKLRGRLQSRGTKSARRLLRKRSQRTALCSGRESLHRQGACRTHRSWYSHRGFERHS